MGGVEPGKTQCCLWLKPESTFRKVRLADLPTGAWFRG